MARIKDIVEIEKRRSDMDACRQIHLYVEGTFCHAYEWSAWLWQRFVREFKVTHTLFKDIEESVALIGCPVANLQSSVPSDGVLTQSGEKEYELLLPVSILPDDYAPELMAQEFSVWKRSLPEPKESNSRKKASEPSYKSLSPVAPPRLTDIMRDVIQFDVNRHSPIECVEFLSEVRQRLLLMI